MSIARLSIPKTTWAKIATRLERAEHAIAYADLRETKTSRPPSGEMVLWEPSELLRTALLTILEREEPFVRKRGTCSHKDLLSTMQKLREYQPH